MPYARDERTPPSEIGTWSLESPFHLLSRKDLGLIERYLGGLRAPDLTIAPDGRPYIYRWHLVERNTDANVYFHVQVLDDPERPLHDHPWDNTSYILSGGYDELSLTPLQATQRRLPTLELHRAPDVIHRPAELAHRLLLAAGQPYTMTLFTTGPKRREWGFWTEDGTWIPQQQVIENRPNGTSVYVGPAR